MKDVLLITIDCWRHDAPERMPELRRLATSRNWQHTDAITGGCATNWSIPTILSSQFYPDVYERTGDETSKTPVTDQLDYLQIRDSVQSLPEAFSGAGYDTAAFVASNFFISKWSDRFDQWFNDGLRRDTVDLYDSKIQKWGSRAKSVASMEPRVSIAKLLRHVRRYFADHNGPSMVWVHLMDPHLPYLPGFNYARDAGLLRSYKAIAEFYQNDTAASDETLQQIKQLYWKCVQRIDDHIEKLVDCAPDDAIVGITADHGEDFEHGKYDHSRLYDSCTRVPFYIRNLEQDIESEPYVRQLDLAPALASDAGVAPPSQWTGKQTMEALPSPMISPWGETTYVGVRTRGKKLIRAFDRGTGELVTIEYYDLTADAKEQENKFDSGDTTDLEEILDPYCTEDWLTKDVSVDQVGEAVKSRPEELGYV